MSYVAENAGENYRGGYATSSVQRDSEIRVQSSTFENYISGTVLIVFEVFFVYIFISIFTIGLMCYAKFLRSRRPNGGFYDPPPMITRYPKSINGGSSSHYGTLQSRQQAPSTLSHAPSQHSEML